MKKLIALLFVLALLIPGSIPRSEAQILCPGITTPIHSKGFEQITVSTVAVGLNVPSGTRVAIIHNQDAVIRFRDDGTDPTNSVGLVITAGQNFAVCGSSLTRFRAIRQDGSDAILNVDYFG